jgi:FkbM family methyltransferase
MSKLLGGIIKRYIAGPEHPAKVRFVRWLGRHAMPREGIVAKAYPDTRLWLNPLDWVEYLLLRYGRHEPLILDFLRANLRPSDTAIVAGINNGLHAIVAAKAVGASGRVIGCDPQPPALLRSRLNIELNAVPEGSLRLVAAALGAERGLTRMPWPPLDNRGAASFFDEGSGFTAPLVTLAEVARSLDLGPIRLLLLDVMGYEIQALAGLGAKLRPEIAVIADHPHNLSRAGESRAALYRCLEDLGYALHDLHGQPVSVLSGPLVELNVIGVLAGCEVKWISRAPAGDAARPGVS